MATEDVYCTLVMSDSYLPGAAVLAHSLRDADTKKKLAVMVTMDSVRHSTVTELKSLYDYVLPVDRIANPNPANLYLMNRGDLLYAFTKINLWRLTQYRKIVYIDSDVVAVRAPDELFDIKADFAAAPDVGWPDAFNSGVMALTPNMGEYWALRTLASSGDSFDGADQGLLNQYYEHKPWHRISFTYNCTPSANYQYEPAYRYHKANISMIHFIGSEKPWTKGRSAQGANGVYKELLTRWWAVYDRHFRAPTTEYIAGRYTPASTIVQSQVKGESTATDGGYASTVQPIQGQQYAQPSTIAEQPEASPFTTEAPFTEPGERAENIAQGLHEPTPTVQQRRFSAPQMEWDATRMAPPAESKPEAVNFPSQVYEFNEDKKQFRPPVSYPEPPKDMWYEVPKEKPAPPQQKPNPIFPWEEREQAKPTRIFIEDVRSPELERGPSPPLDEELAVEPTTPATPIIKVTSEDPWQSFGAVNKNAWDQISGIDDYVRSLAARHQKKPKTPAVSTPTSATPLNTTPPEETPVRQRRESLILTDFPTAVERPSLPVTPAPMRRSFWGKERDEGNLPPAEGVPDQADWDPEQQLESLRRNSLIDINDLKMPNKKMPRRKMPGSAAPVPEAALSQPHVPLSREVSPTGSQRETAAETTPASAPAPESSADPMSKVKAQFSAVDFAPGTKIADEGEELMSPTEHGSRHF